jgi:anti-sigma regulatory factor (Ser/Thr protein kinase)
MATSSRRTEIEEFIVGLVADQSHDVARRVSEKFGITRQAAALHLRRLIKEQRLVAEGETKSRRYRLPDLYSEVRRFPVDRALTEDRVWSEFVAPALRDLPVNLRDILHYGTTEMVNNVIDHSGSPDVIVGVQRNAARTAVRIVDNGVGIFRKIREACDLDDDRQAIFELVKGKLTTDPERHTGEGIFFTSRMVDDFTILSGELLLWHTRDAPDWLTESRSLVVGTAVGLEIRSNSTHTMQETFDRYATEQDDYAFSRTHVVVNLLRSQGEKLVSRSQARRLLVRLERFREIILDFKGVESIGPAFTDEIFRVFARVHPSSRLTPINATEDVTRMIRRVVTEPPNSNPTSHRS